MLIFYYSEKKLHPHALPLSKKTQWQPMLQRLFRQELTAFMNQFIYIIQVILMTQKVAILQHE